MSLIPLLTVALSDEADIVGARQRARQIAGLLGLETQDQTRVATAVSEISRNALSYGGGGRMEMSVDADSPRKLMVIVRDRGPGIANLASILDGNYRSATGMGVGITGTQRLMDEFRIESPADGGTKVTFSKLLPIAAPALTKLRIGEIAKVLVASGRVDPVAEVRIQNQELMESLKALKAKQEESDRLNAELEKINLSVVALNAALDEKASQLAHLNEALESRVSTAIAERQAANDALRQSQKMEAVGQLTGGIAHDFNNLLQIITGSLETLQRRVSQDDERLRRPVEHAMSGAQRAATLTQRLLAFSRRQPLEPKPLNANVMVDGMGDMMRRTLGEMVKVHIHLADDLWTIEADAHQLENAILNLGVNARDAMPRGGSITIMTANCVVGEGDAEDDEIPGHYVALSVCDTGSGMSEEVLARVLEPFFTTKEAGKGTGLGLSMVYGLVKQSGGHLRIESSLGRGTTVTLYLPRFIGLRQDDDISAEAVVMPARPGDVILLVEDDDGVRRHTVEILTELGYQVLEAHDGDSALAILSGTARIDLLLTDVVLAGRLTGRDVANYCFSLRSNTAVLFATGYSHEALGDNYRIDAGIDILVKPFSYAALASRVAQLIRVAAARQS